METLEKKNDVQFKVVFDAIRRLMSPTGTERQEIGFHLKDDMHNPKLESDGRLAGRANLIRNVAVQVSHA